MSTVYIASCLKDRHPDVHLALTKALADAGVPLVEVPGTGNIWIRDWMPIKCGDKFVKFKPKADTVKWPFLEAPADRGDLPFNCWGDIIQYSDLILDGGNVVRSPDGRRVIMCEQTLRDNGNDIDLRRKLTELLQAEIIWIPNEPGDTLGHADGIVHWIDNDTVFVNDYRSMRDGRWHIYASELGMTLCDNRIGRQFMPYAYDLCRELTEERFRKEFPDADEQNPAYGYYLNFLKVGNTVLHSIFHIDRDVRCEDALIDAWPDVKLVDIDCARLSMLGGLLHCVTWES